MKILIAITNFMIGGAQTFVVRLATSLSTRHSVYIYNLNPNYTEDEIIKGLPSSVKLISFRLPWLLDRSLKRIDRLCWKFGWQKSIWELLKQLHFKSILKILKIDIINSHLYHSDEFIASTIRKTKTPLIITDHGDYCYVVEQKKTDTSRVLNIFNRANGLVYISERNLKQLSKYTENSQLVLRKIYNGISTQFQQKYSVTGRWKLGIPDDAVIFGMIARGIQEKGWYEAIQAFKLVKLSTDKNVHLILVGDSEYLKCLKQALEQSLNDEINSGIHFVGFTSEPNYWIECFDVGVLPTYFAGESLPNSIVEYLFFGKPVIATAVGGIPEMIAYNHQNAGFLVELNQHGQADITSLTKAMLKYVNDPILLEQHSHLASQACERFKIEICTEKYEKLFQQFLN